MDKQQAMVIGCACYPDAEVRVKVLDPGEEFSFKLIFPGRPDPEYETATHERLLAIAAEMAADSPLCREIVAAYNWPA